MKRALKAVAGLALGEYALYRVGRFEAAPALALPTSCTVRAVDAAEIRAADCSDIRDSAWYAGPEAAQYGLVTGNGLEALACFWWGARYATRGSWRIGPADAKLVHIVTSPAARGRGLAPVLVQYACAALRDQGREQFYARIWHNHDASIRALGRAGWRQVGFLMQFEPLGLGRRLCFQWRSR